MKYERRHCGWEPNSVPCRQGIDIRFADRGPLVFLCAKIVNVTVVRGIDTNASRPHSKEWDST